MRSNTEETNAAVAYKLPKETKHRKGLHLIRAISPDLVADYARAHDDGLWATFLDLIGYPQQAADDSAGADPDELPLDRDRSNSGSREEEGEAAAENGPPSPHRSAEVGAQQAGQLGGREAASPAGPHASH